MTSPERGKSTAPPAAVWWRLPLLLALVLAGLLVFRSLGGGQQSTSPADGTPVHEAEGGKTVALTIEAGKGTLRSFPDLPWREGMTVADLLATAAERPDGPTFTQQGTGPAALVTAIDGTSNEGAAGSNWTYTVGGRRADRSFAVYTLQPGDSVLWKFAPSQ